MTGRREDDPTVADLVRDLSRETSELVRKEVEFAKLELADKLPQLKTGIGGIAVAGPMVFAGFLMMLVAAALGLNRVLAMPWLSALLVGVATAAVGGIALLVGRRRLHVGNFVPRRSLKSLKRDGETVARHAGAQ